MTIGPPARSFLGEGSLPKFDYRKKLAPLILTSLLVDLDDNPPKKQKKQSDRCPFLAFL